MNRRFEPEHNAYRSWWYRRPARLYALYFLHGVTRAYKGPA